MKALLAILGMYLAAASSGTTPVGKWRGKMNANIEKQVKAVQQTMKTLPPEQQGYAKGHITVLEAQKRGFEAMPPLLFEFKKDGSVNIITETGQTNAKPRVIRWKQKGDRITIFDYSPRSPNHRDISGAVSKDGKSIKFDLTLRVPGRANGMEQVLTLVRL
jgi:hypothetical protein